MKPLNAKTKKILLADDDNDDCLIFEEALKEMSIATELTIAKDGHQLMETLARTVPPPPDLIFLDLNMPRKNGSECLNAIRSTPTLQHIPVVILSTSHQRATINECYDGGANYYICKPNDFLKFKDVLRTVLSFSYQALETRPNREQFLLTAI